MEERRVGVINHNRIEEMQLGMCDAGICRPRDNPFVKPIFNEISGFNCPNTIAPEAKNIPRVELFCDNYSGICAGLGSSPSYDPNNSTDMGTKLSRMAANIICQEINYMRTNGGFNKAENSDGGTFTTTGNECENIFVLAQAIDSKKIIWQFGDTKSVQQVNRERYEKNACPMTEPYRTYPGLFKDTGGLLSNPKISSAELKCSASDFSSGNNGYSQCEEVSKVEVNITFEESNSKYIVNKQLEKTHYIIKLVDNRFTLFTPNYTSTREPDCLRSETLGHPGCNPAAWTCYSITNQSMPPDDWGCYTSAS